MANGATDPLAKPAQWTPSGSRPAGARSKGARAVAVVILLSTLMGVAIGVGYWGFSYDDAFVTYRYAQNLASLGHLEYNPGEAVLGTSAPGYALALGVLSRVTHVPVPGLGTLLSVLAILSLVVLGTGCLTGHTSRWQLGVAVLFSGLAFSSQWNIEMLGSEAFPVLGLCCWAVALGLGERQSRSRQAIAGLLVALAMTFRLDAAILGTILGVAIWAWRRRVPWAFGVAAGVPLVAWLGWLRTTYGRLIPATFDAKRSEMKAHAQLFYAADEWRWFERTLPRYAAVLLVLLAVLAVAIMVWRWQSLATEPRRSVPVLAMWVLAHELVYHWVGVPFAPWYHVLLFQALLVSAAATAMSVGAFVARGWTPFRAHRAITMLGVGALCLLPIGGSGVVYATRHSGVPPDPRFVSYARLAEVINTFTDPGDTTASVEIGVLGYFTHARILDLRGLVSPEVVAARVGGTLPDLVAARRPRFIVDASAFSTELTPVFHTTGIAGRYREVANIQHGGDPNRRLRLLMRIEEDRQTAGDR